MMISTQYNIILCVTTFPRATSGTYAKVAGKTLRLYNRLDVT